MPVKSTQNFKKIKFHMKHLALFTALFLGLTCLVSCSKEDKNAAGKVKLAEVQQFAKEHNIQLNVPADMSPEMETNWTEEHFNRVKESIEANTASQTTPEEAEILMQESKAFGAAQIQVSSRKEFLALLDSYPGIKKIMERDLTPEQFENILQEVDGRAKIRAGK